MINSVYPIPAAPESEIGAGGPRDDLRRAVKAAAAAGAVLDIAKAASARAEARMREERQAFARAEDAADAAAAADADLAALAFAEGTAELPATAIGHDLEADEARRRLAALERAGAVLAEKLVVAEKAANSADAARHAAAKAVLAVEARALADRAGSGLAAAVDAWRTLDPLTRAWFPGQPGTPGGPVPLDGATQFAYRTIAAIVELIPVAQEPPSVRSARAAADAERWRGLFDRLLVDAEAKIC